MTKRRITRLIVGPAVAGVAMFGVAPLVLASTASASPAVAQYGPVSAATLFVSSTTVAPGGTVTVSGTGFDANSTVTLTLDGVVIGTATTNAAGAFSTTVTIPSGLAAGYYTIIATDSLGRTSSITIYVTGASTTAVAAPSAAAPSSTSSSSSGLAFTGTDAAATAGAGAGAIALGGLLVLGSRRRRRNAWTD